MKLLYATGASATPAGITQITGLSLPGSLSAGLGGLSSIPVVPPADHLLAESGETLTSEAGEQLQPES